MLSDISICIDCEDKFQSHQIKAAADINCAILRNGELRMLFSRSSTNFCRRKRQLELSSKARRAETKTAVPEPETGDIEM